MNKKNCYTLLTLLLTVAFFVTSCKKEEEETPPAGTIQLATIKVGTTVLDLQGANNDIPVDNMITVDFNNMLDAGSAAGSFMLYRDNDIPVDKAVGLENDNKTVVLETTDYLEPQSDYTLKISNTLKGASGETFPGLTVNFSTTNGTFTIETITLNSIDFSGQALRDVDWKDLEIKVRFTEQLDPDNYQESFFIAENFENSMSLSQDNLEVTINNLEDLDYYKKYTVFILNTLTAQNGFKFSGFQNSFHTALDSTYKFPSISDDELLDLVQGRTFDYFYGLAHPVAGLARERNTSGDIVTIGGGGFGVMALVVGIERNFISRPEGLGRLGKILDFLETCDRFHGAWPHWLNGSTGVTHPFSTNDDGADLVETSFMVQGLYTMRQYLDPGSPNEQDLIDRINILIDGVEWDWFTREQNVLYWHWSPNVGWAMNMQIKGYNETLITYIMAASSTTFGVDAAVYHQGYASNGAIVNGNSYYGYMLPLGYAYGGPLFFTHYSFLGLDPRNLSDTYANYWEQNVNHSLINRAYCIDNPSNWIGYRTDSWGLTASDNPWGYSAHSPTNDKGVITPTAAVSALPYTPEESMDAIRHFYFVLGDRTWGEYGFYDAFCPTEGWWANSYLAIDQGPIVCMIENHRTGLLWDLFMSSPEVQDGLTKLGFSY
jgi:hypothetical protein